MFKSLNEKELMMVNGGFYYVPKYKYGECVGTVQVASGSGIKYYRYELVHVSQYSYEWRYVAHY